MNISNNNKNNTTREVGTDSIPGMSTSDSCKDSESTKSKNDGVCEMNDMIQNMSTADDKDISTDGVSICANCGKEGANNICNKCKMVKYCNAVCKKVHKKKHKKQCEEHLRIAAERAAKLHDIELFKQPPPEFGECPICFLRLPVLQSGWRYYACCGKTICCGCDYAPVYDNQGNKVDIDKQNQCAFCRVVAPKSDEEVMKRIMKRVEAGDPIAMYSLGTFYRYGMNGMPQDYNKALEYCHRAADLGYSTAYNGIGSVYEMGIGVEVDMKKATYYYELAAMGGDDSARYNLGVVEEERGNVNRALKHYMIAARSGSSDSLKKIKQLYSSGYATKEDYTKALQSYQAYLGEIKSIQRDKAAAAKDEYRYY